MELDSEVSHFCMSLRLLSSFIWRPRALPLFSCHLQNLVTSADAMVVSNSTINLIGNLFCRGLEVVILKFSTPNPHAVLALGNIPPVKNHMLCSEG